MAVVQIPNLPAAIALSGSEQLEAVQAGTSVRVTVEQISRAINQPANPNLSIQFNSTGVFGGSSGITTDGVARITLGDQQTTRGSLVLANTAAGAWPVTIQSSNSATAAWTMTLPPAVAAGNGFILTSNTSGVTSWTNPTALGIDLDVGSTAITNGTVSRLLFQGAGDVLQQSANLTFSSSTLTLGVAGSATGAAAFTGATSGTATITAQATAGSPTLTLPNASGTLVSTASAPLSINATTGAISITGAAGQVLAGATPAFTATPTLGVAGTTAGTLALSGATSGTVTLQTAAIAGTGTIFQFPSSNGASGTILTTTGSGVTTWSTATFPSTATSAGTILRADGTNWVATTATYPTTTTAGTLLASATANAVSASATPTLGVAGTTAGTLTLSGLTSGTVTLQTAAAAGTGTIFQFPSSNGANGTVLTTTGSGVTTWTSPSALGIDLDVGTTAITNGTAGRVLFQGAGDVLQQSASLFWDSANNQLDLAAGTEAIPALSTVSDSNTGLWFPAADTIAASTGGSERMRINSSGNVGIGTSSPSYLLDVSGAGAQAIRIRNTTTNIDAYLLAQNTVGTALFGVNANGPYIYTADATAITFSTNATERMRITSAGLVGIGTASPANRLSVLDSSAAAGLFYGYSVVGANANNNNGSIQIGNFSGNCGRLDYDAVSNSTGTLSLYNTFAGPLVLGTGNTERMRITSAGNVGIGTPSPGAPLDINVATGYIRVNSTTNTNPAYIYLLNNGGNFFVGRENSVGTAFGTTAYSSVLFAAGAYPMVFFTNSAERMRITSTGNVLIGTTSSPTTGTQCLTIETETAPTATPADTVTLYSSDLSAGNTMPSFYTEGTIVGTGTPTADRTIAVRINGTVYYLLASTIP